MANGIGDMAIVDAPYADKRDAQLVALGLSAENGGCAEYPYAGCS